MVNLCRSVGILIKLLKFWEGGALCGNVGENGSEDPWTVAVVHSSKTGAAGGAKFEYLAPGLVLSPTVVLTSTLSTIFNNVSPYMCI